MGSIDAHYDTGLHLSLFLVRGSVTATDLIRAVETHYGNNPTSIAIWDFSRAELSGLDMADLIRISQAVKKHSRARKNARSLLVMQRSQGSFLGKLYREVAELQGSPVRYDLVESLDEAYALLGIEDPFADSAPAAG